MKQRSAVVVFFVALLTTFCNAGMLHVDCDAPTVFPDAAVNVVFLPYEVGTNLSGRPSGFFPEIGLLMKLDTLLHIVPYGSVGAVQLDPPHSSSEECTAQLVIDKLTGKRFSDGPQIKRGHGLIVVSGMLYQEGIDYYAKTFVTFLRRDTSEEINFVRDQLQLSAQPSTQTIAFQPRHLTQQQLLQLKNAYRESNIIYDDPSLTASKHPLPSPMAKCIGPSCGTASTGYVVTLVKGDWFHVRWIEPKDPSVLPGEGWIHAGSEVGTQPIENLMPELYFVRGVTGYLIARSGLGTNPDAQSVLDLLSRDFTTYIEREANNDDEAAALAHELAGLAKAALSKADLGVTEFSSAVRLNPSSSDVRNLLGCTSIWNGWNRTGAANNGPGIDGRFVVKTLLAAIALNPSDRRAFHNLSAFYNAAQTNLFRSGLSSEEIETGIKQLNQDRVPGR